MLTFAVSIPFTPYKSGKEWDGQLHNVKASLMLCLLTDEPRKFIMLTIDKVRSERLRRML